MENDKVFDVETLNKLVDQMSQRPEMRGLLCSSCGQRMFILISNDVLGWTEEQIEQAWKKGVWVI